MQTFLFVLILLAALAAVVALVRGIVIFLRTTEADLKGEGLNMSAVRQNKMMQYRIFFQAIAIILVVLLLLFARSG